MAQDPKHTNQNQQPEKKGMIGRSLNFMFNPEIGRTTKQVGQTHMMFLQMLAALFASNNTLPKEHRFFRPGAQFSIGDLFHETLARIDWHNRTRLPQTVFFCAVWGLLVSALLYVMTFVLLLIAAPSHAYAADNTAPASTSLFTVADPSKDLGLSLLDHLAFAGSTQSILPDTKAEDPLNSGYLQNALRSMLKMYSTAVLVFATFLLLYHIIMLIVESAWSGKPLEGANQIWGPLRLVIAIGLLVPVSNGLNSGQYITIQIAKIGSSLATNVWGAFSTALNDKGYAQEMVMNRPDIGQDFYNMIMISVCKNDINRDGFTQAGALLTDTAMLSGHRALFDRQNYTCKIGPVLNQGMCGMIKIPAVSGVTESGDVCNPNDTNASLNASGAAGAAPQADSAGNLQKVIRSQTAAPNLALWAAADKIGQNIATYVRNYNDGLSNGVTAGDSNADNPGSDANVQKDIKAAIKAYYASMGNIYDVVIPKAINDYTTAQKADIAKYDYGWATAGAYFMRISAMQRAVSSALEVTPTAELGGIFNRGGATGSKDNNMSHTHFLKLLYPENHDATDYGSWVKQNIESALADNAGCSQASASDSARSVSAQTDGIKPCSVSFQIQSTMELREEQDKTTGSGKMAHQGSLFHVDPMMFINMLSPAVADPFSSVFNVGKFIYDTSLWMMSFGIFFPVLMTIGTFMFTTSLFPCFILPLWPMMKFVLAVFGWLLAVFEALVGMPLFALAHLTPGGKGLFDPARRGYEMLLHIALKPVLLIFGLIGAMILLSLGLFVLNVVYRPALLSVWGTGGVFPLTAFILMGFYCINAWTICKHCLTIIDHIAEKSMQWFGMSGYGFQKFEGSHTDMNAMLNLAGKGAGAAANLGAGIRHGLLGKQGSGGGSPQGGLLGKGGLLRKDGGKNTPVGNFMGGRGIHGEESEDSQEAQARWVKETADTQQKIGGAYADMESAAVTHGIDSDEFKNAEKKYQGLKDHAKYLQSDDVKPQKAYTGVFGGILVGKNQKVGKNIDLWTGNRDFTGGSSFGKGPDDNGGDGGGSPTGSSSPPGGSSVAAETEFGLERFANDGKDGNSSSGGFSVGSNPRVSNVTDGRAPSTSPGYMGRLRGGATGAIAGAAMGAAAAGGAMGNGGDAQAAPLAPSAPAAGVSQPAPASYTQAASSASAPPPIQSVGVSGGAAGGAAGTSSFSDRGSTGGSSAMHDAGDTADSGHHMGAAEQTAGGDHQPAGLGGADHAQPAASGSSDTGHGPQAAEIADAPVSESAPAPVSPLSSAAAGERGPEIRIDTSGVRDGFEGAPKITISGQQSAPQQSAPAQPAAPEAPFIAPNAAVQNVTGGRPAQLSQGRDKAPPPQGRNESKDKA